MGLTRGQVLDRMVSLLGDGSTQMRTYLTESVNQMLFALWDMHDWDFKHNIGTLTLAVGVESYDLSIPTPNIRSAQDLDVLYDTTVGRFLWKVDLRDIKKRYPKTDQNQDPTHYAPWGAKTIFIHPKPIQNNVLKYLYLSKPTLPTDDLQSLETFCGLPDYVQYLFEKMLLAEGFLYYDESRRIALLDEIARIWLPNAINADMKHLESGARFKFWEEELSPLGITFDDFLRRSWWGEGY